MIGLFVHAVYLLSFLRRSEPFRGITSPWRAILGWTTAIYVWQFQVKWIIEDASNGAIVEMAPGEQRGNVEANSLAEQFGSEDTYDSYLRIKNIDKAQDGDKTITFVIKVCFTIGRVLRLRRNTHWQ